MSTPPARGPEPPAAQAPRQPPRDVATWTYQAGTDAPVGYVSWRPWKRQERAKRLTPPARLFNLFRGRTVADADQRAEGVSLPLPPGTLLCPCGAVMLHEKAHKAGDLHDQRTRGATTRNNLHPAAATPSAAARQMLARAGREAEFAEWLLQTQMERPSGSAQALMRRDVSELPGLPLCTGTERTGCKIAAHLSKLNAFFWNARWELRKLSGTPAKLSLVSIDEQSLPLPKWSQIHPGAALAHHLLKTHPCLAALDISAGSFKGSETLLRDALEDNASIKSFKIHFHSFVRRKDFCWAISSLMNLEQMECSTAGRVFHSGHGGSPEGTILERSQSDKLAHERQQRQGVFSSVNGKLFLRRTFATCFHDRRSLSEIPRRIIEHRRPLDLVIVTVDGCKVRGVQLAIDLFFVHDTARRNVDVVAWASDLVIGTVYDSIEDHYSLVIATVDGCELSGVQLAIDLFVVRDTARRNVDVAAWASDLVIGTVYDRYSARALQRVARHPVLLDELAEQLSVSSAEAADMVYRGLRSIQSMDDFMWLAGVVRERIQCHAFEDSRAQMDSLNDYCWSAVRRYLDLDIRE
ncbi:hypothetical protein V5799_005448 [Amblyomma americanum]|uniref:Uncharacterized protein n=1 Tax=Amblyomma americanum TaxID=6943 RepID=A0AAQ4DZ81_AMBAM